MNPMTVGANSNLAISDGQQLAMAAGRILRQLIGSQGRIELAHVAGVGVTLAAELRNVFFLDMPAEPGRFAHRTFRVV